MHVPPTTTERRGRGRRLTALGLAAVGLVLFAAPASASIGVDPGTGIVAPNPGSPNVGEGSVGDGDGILVPDVPDVPDVPSVTVTVGEDGVLSQSVMILVLLTVGSIVPGLLLLTTSFTRFVVVLSLTKQALGLQTVPPSQVLVGLALFLSVFSMSQTFGEINDQAVQPYLAGEIEQADALKAGFEPMRSFMLAQTREADLQLFVDLSGEAQPSDPTEVSATTLIPAFVISELRAAFVMGFMIFIPFLVVDLVVAAVLMSMGMMMLPPVFISLPLKLLLFVLVDGWVLIAGSLVRSVGG
ncbi:MAG: flagellar biosynthetic protein FliP [Nitriliruptoraceae bacterium]